MTSACALPSDLETDDAVPEADEGFIPLTDPDITEAELAAVDAALRSPMLSTGALTEAFEAEFSAYTGRRYAVAVASGTIGLLVTLQAYGIGPGAEVIASPYAFRETIHAVALCGARPVFADIDYWAGTILPAKVAPRISEKTRAIIASNTNGHPAAWGELRSLATAHGLILIEDSTEAIGSKYAGALVGSFGDASIFDFSQPSLLTCGEGGMVVTDDLDLAIALRRLRAHRPQERTSVVVSVSPPYQCGISNVSAALALAQLRRLDEILERRRLVEAWYYKHVQSFEGIKDPYVGPNVTEVNWFLYNVHLGTRFARSSRDAIIEDLRVEQVEAVAYCNPLHVQRFYFDLGYRRGDYFVTEKLADRAVSLPFHSHLTEDQISFIVTTMKESSINVGAGAAIY